MARRGMAAAAGAAAGSMDTGHREQAATQVGVQPRSEDLVRRDSVAWARKKVHDKARWRSRRTEGMHDGTHEEMQRKKKRRGKKQRRSAR